MWQLDATGKCSGHTEDDGICGQAGACAHHQPHRLEIIIIGEVEAKINRGVIYRKLSQRNAFCGSVRQPSTQQWCCCRIPLQYSSLTNEATDWKRQELPGVELPYSGILCRAVVSRLRCCCKERYRKALQRPAGVLTAWLNHLTPAESSVQEGPVLACQPGAKRPSEFTTTKRPGNPRKSPSGASLHCL